MSARAASLFARAQSARESAARLQEQIREQSVRRDALAAEATQIEGALKIVMEEWVGHWWHRLVTAGAERFGWSQRPLAPRSLSRNCRKRTCNALSPSRKGWR